jgi:hypothetical protein
MQQPRRRRWQAIAQAHGDRQTERLRAAIAQFGAVVDACTAALDSATDNAERLVRCAAGGLSDFFASAPSARPSSASRRTASRSTWAARRRRASP